MKTIKTIIQSIKQVFQNGVQRIKHAAQPQETVMVNFAALRLGRFD